MARTPQKGDLGNFFAIGMFLRETWRGEKYCWDTLSTIQPVVMQIQTQRH